MQPEHLRGPSLLAHQGEGASGWLRSRIRDPDHPEGVSKPRPPRCTFAGGVLRRRDGEDLFLGLRSREESVRDALGVLARVLLAASVDPDTRRRVASTLAASLPWTAFLPDDEREEFLEALTSTAAACVEVDTFEPLAHVIEGWRATAEIHANPELAEHLSVQRNGPAVRIRRPRPS